MNSDSSYKQIVKSSGIFGSSQLINVALGIVRSKLTAVFLGALGVGVFGLFQSIVDLTRSFSGLGLDSGAVKTLSQTGMSEDELGKTLYTINAWYFGTAILGILSCLVFARPLGFWAFESYDYTLHIVGLSLAVFFIAINAGLTACLQGMRKITYMALASTISSIVTLLVMIPIYYYWRIKGIIPFMILSALIITVISWFFCKKLNIHFSRVPILEVFLRGRGMLRLGFYIVIAGVLSTASLFAVRAYIMRSYIDREEGLESVGLFQVAWVTATLFWGIVLRSVNTDFFPKLCSIVDEKEASKRFVNEQTHFSLLLVAPIILGLIVFSKYVVYLLYTSEFFEAVSTLQWHFVGAFFKILATPVASIMLAKNRGGVHLACETIFWVTYLLVSYLLYPYFNIEAVGLAYLIAYAVYIPTVLVAGYQLMGVTWDCFIIKGFAINVVLIVVFFLFNYFLPQYYLLFGSALVLLSTLFSIHYMRAIIKPKDIVAWFKKRF